MDQNISFMSRAVELSFTKMRQGEGGPFGAVIVKDKKIVGEGWNKVISTNDPTAHAEVEAIRDACRKLNNFDLSDCEIYTSCEPCPMCLSAILWARIKKIYFCNSREDAAECGFDDAYFYKQVSLPLTERDVESIFLSHADARKAFEEWQANPLRTNY